MTIKEAVSEVLTTDFISRDDDNYLYVSVSRLLNIEYGTILDLLSKLDYKTVERERRRLQRLYPDLRGSTYEKRHKRAEEKRKEYSPTYFDKLSMWWSSI